MLDFGYYCMDCLEGMKEFPDDYFDLAVVDPPYGGGKSLKERISPDSAEDLNAMSVKKKRFRRTAQAVNGLQNTATI